MPGIIFEDVDIWTQSWELLTPSECLENPIKHSHKPSGLFSCCWTHIWLGPQLLSSLRLHTLSVLMPWSTWFVHSGTGKIVILMNITIPILDMVGIIAKVALCLFEGVTYTDIVVYVTQVFSFSVRSAIDSWLLSKASHLWSLSY